MDQSAEFGLAHSKQPQSSRPTSREGKQLGLLIKPWGDSRTLVLTHCIQIELIHVSRGGYSSPHEHVSKHNLFLVTEGRLLVTVFERHEGELCSHARHLLTASDQPLVVEARTPHQFLCLENCIAYEVYWPTQGSLVDRGDIRRFGTNGRLESFREDDLPDYLGASVTAVASATRTN